MCTLQKFVRKEVWVIQYIASSYVEILDIRFV
jgi:hypothetical protein